MLAYVGASLAILGLSWRHLGSILAPTWPSWLHLGALLGLSWDHFVVILMFFTSKPSLGQHFDDLDVQNRQNHNSQILSIAAPITVARLVGICHVHLAFAPMICISRLHISHAPLVHELHLSFAPLIYAS